MTFARSFGRVAISGALVWLLAGCVTLLPRGEPVQLYRFGFVVSPDPRPRPGDTSSIRSSFGLTSSSLPVAADGIGILTSRGDSVAYVADARWAAPAGVLFAEAAVQAFDADGLRLVRGGAGAAANLSLDVIVFEARYIDDGAPTALVSVHASLTGTDGRVFAEQTFKSSQRAEANRVSAIVSAYDRAVTDDLETVVRWTALAWARRDSAARPR